MPAFLKTPFSSSTATASKHELKLANRIDDYFRSELILKRNKRMGQRVLELLEQHPERSFFFAFGAGKPTQLTQLKHHLSTLTLVCLRAKGHFLGNNSIVDFVEQGGFEVVRVGAANTKNVNAHKSSTTATK